MIQSELFPLPTASKTPPVPLVLSLAAAPIVGFGSVGRAAAGTYLLESAPNEYARADRAEDPYGAWDAAIEAGRQYLCSGTCAVEDFIARYRSRIQPWMRDAVVFCWQNPSAALVFRNSRYLWRVRRRGEYVEISLPYHDFYGERYWITKDGINRVLVNED